MAPVRGSMERALIPSLVVAASINGCSSDKKVPPPPTVPAPTTPDTSARPVTSRNLRTWAVATPLPGPFATLEDACAHLPRCKRIQADSQRKPPMIQPGDLVAPPLVDWSMGSETRDDGDHLLFAIRTGDGWFVESLRAAPGSVSYGGYGLTLPQGQPMLWHLWSKTPDGTVAFCGIGPSGRPSCTEELDRARYEPRLGASGGTRNRWPVTIVGAPGDPMMGTALLTFP
jgi:hypothetical protein